MEGSWGRQEVLEKMWTATQGCVAASTVRKSSHDPSKVEYRAMLTTACISENNLYGWHTQISEAMSGSRRGNPADVYVPVATRLQPQVDLPTPEVETVFIADPNVSEQTIQVAESWGQASKTFSSGHAVLEANIEHQAGCLITELQLPDMSGIELLEKLKMRASILPVVVLTAHADVSSAVKAVRLGAMAVLEKPCSDSNLSSTILGAILQCRERRDAQLNAIDMRARLSSLNNDEASLVEMILEGMKNTVIARRVGVSLRTIENRRQRVYEKMGAHCIADLVQRVLQARQTW
jgi:FixJ family two-component response regulator